MQGFSLNLRKSSANKKVQTLGEILDLCWDKNGSNMVQI